MKNLLNLIFLILLHFMVFGQDYYTIDNVPNDQLVDATDFVSNPDNIISYSAENELNTLIQKIKDSTTAEIAVVLINSIGYQDIDDFATQLFNKWGIGKSANNNGLLFLLVYDTRGMVFRTGYGLEGVLPDAVLFTIMRNVITPELKQGKFDKGINAGFKTIYDFLTDPESAMEIKAAVKKDNTVLNIYIAYNLIFFIISILVLYRNIKSNKKKSEKFKTLNNNGYLFAFLGVFIQSFFISSILFFIFRNWIRKKPMNCLTCNQKMRKLDNFAASNYLTNGQNTEVKIGSVNYDVWLCTCGNLEVFNFKNSNKYIKCLSCNFITCYVLKRETIKHATTHSTGLRKVTQSCKYCGARHINKYVIPKINNSSSDSGGSSSSGSSGGSWGGGSTGGGGARGGW